MAVLDHLSVRVIVDGQPANEYDDDEELDEPAKGVATKYVEAISGKSFKFSVRIDPQYKWEDEDTILVRVRLDGKYAGNVCLHRERFCSRDGLSDSVKGMTSSQMTDRKLFPYIFADLETRDLGQYDNTFHLKELYADLGTMVVTFSRAKNLGRRKGSLKATRLQDLEAVPEKVLKGRSIDVATKYDKPVQTTRRSVRTKDLDDYPMATFRFKYRTRRALQSLLIIERTPEPVPLEERTVEQLSREELEELEELVRRQRASDAIKKETFEKVKRERSSYVADSARPLKTSRDSLGQTVYHIDSDDDK